MGTATHKLSGASISVASKLSLDRLKALSSQAASETVPTGLYKGAKARIRTNGVGSATRQNFRIGTEQKSMMTFSVSFVGTDGGCRAHSRIESFKTKQSVFLGFLPAGPKELLGWNWYQNFMRNFARLVHDADASAQVQVFEIT